MKWWSDLAGAIVGGIKDWATARQQAKARKAESEARIEEAKTNAMIAMWGKQADAEVEWEKLSIQNSGWKDEYLTIYLTAIVGACFVPGLQDYVKVGFEFLATATPLWFQTSFLIVIGSAFGVRTFGRFMDVVQAKKGQRSDIAPVPTMPDVPATPSATPQAKPKK